MANSNNGFITRPDSFPAGPGSPLPADGGPSQPSRPQLRRRWEEDSRRARQRTRYTSRVEVIVQAPDRTRVLARHDFSDGDIQRGLDAAIAEASLLLTPLSPPELLDPANNGYWRSPRMEDLVLACGGKVLAVVSATAHGPVVHRFFPSASRR